MDKEPSMSSLITSRRIWRVTLLLSLALFLGLDGLLSACPLSGMGVAMPNSGPCCYDPCSVSSPQLLAVLQTMVQPCSPQTNPNQSNYPIYYRFGRARLEESDLPASSAWSALRVRRSYGNISDSSSDFEGPNGFNWW